MDLVELCTSGYDFGKAFGIYQVPRPLSIVDHIDDQFGRHHDALHIVVSYSPFGWQSLKCSCAILVSSRFQDPSLPSFHLPMSDNGQSSSLSSLESLEDTSSRPTSNGSHRFIGQGSLAGRAVYRLGAVVLDSFGALRRASRITEIQRNIPLMPGNPLIDSSEIRALYDDLLELARPGMYKSGIRNKMVNILWTQINAREVHHLADAVGRWHDIETQLLFASLFQDVREVLSRNINARKPLSNLGMTSVVRLIHFFCEVAQVNRSKCRAILEAGLISLLQSLPHCILYLAEGNRSYSTIVFQFQASVLRFISDPGQQSCFRSSSTTLMNTIEDAISYSIIDDLQCQSPSGNASKANHHHRLYCDLLAFSGHQRIQKVIWSQIDSGNLHDLSEAIRSRNPLEMQVFLSDLFKTKCTALSKARTIAAVKPPVLSLLYLVRLITRVESNSNRLESNAGIDKTFIPLLSEFRKQVVSGAPVIRFKRGITQSNQKREVYMVSVAMLRLTIYTMTVEKYWITLARQAQIHRNLQSRTFTSIHIILLRMVR